ncbi:MAG TPA: PorV/PorQ family protein, partial [Bacteroidales bacterium]|nr:PorV/PorQ family protein [Bacteroidales bacterium]
GIELEDGTSKVGNTVTFDLGALYFPGDFSIGNSTVRPTVGMSISNFGGKVEYSSSGYKNPLPTTLRLGAAAKISLDPDGINILTPSIEFSKMLVHVDSTGSDGSFQALFSSWGSYEYFNGSETVSVGLGKQIMYGTGIEYWYANLIALRGGYYNEAEANGGRKFVTFGGSIRYQPIEINASYALQQGQGSGGNIFRLGLLFNL